MKIEGEGAQIPHDKKYSIKAPEKSSILESTDERVYREEYAAKKPDEIIADLKEELAAIDQLDYSVIESELQDRLARKERLKEKLERLEKNKI